MRLYDVAWGLYDVASMIKGSYRKTYPYKVFAVFMFAYIAKLFWGWSYRYDYDTQYGEMMNLRAGSVFMGVFGLLQALINVGLIGDMWAKNNKDRF